jgi:hypothetical protein
MLCKLLIHSAVFLISGAILSATGPPAAMAQTGPCAARSEIIEWLDDRFHEHQTGLGVIGTGAVLELFTSIDGTWTIIVTDRAQRTCAIAAGTSWTQIEPPAIKASDDR